MKIHTLLLLALVSCKNESSKFTIDHQYNTEFKTYKEELSKGRIKYLQLAGLFKLDTLNNTFGKHPNNNFVLNIESLPSKIGTISMFEDALTFKASKDVLIKNDNDSIITSIKLNLDNSGNSIKLYHSQLNWQVITRSKQLYLRVWDTKNLAIKSFKSFEQFNLNPEFIFEAQFTYFDTEKTESVKSKLGVNANTKFIGKVAFQYQGQIHHLDVGNGGFTMVSDKTTGNSTYGAGRYMYLKLPKTNGKVSLDFNHLYNPPCTFSEFTTCLYPPRQNVLAFKIMAGEKLKSL